MKITITIDVSETEFQKTLDASKQDKEKFLKLLRLDAEDIIPGAVVDFKVENI